MPNDKPEDNKPAAPPAQPAAPDTLEPVGNGAVQAGKPAAAEKPKKRRPHKSHH